MRQCFNASILKLTCEQQNLLVRTTIACPQGNFAVLRDCCVIEDGAFVPPNAMVPSFTVYGGRPGTRTAEQGEGLTHEERQGRVTHARGPYDPATHSPTRCGTAGILGRVAAGPVQGLVRQVCAGQTLSMTVTASVTV